MAGASNISFGVKLLWRDWKGGELSLLVTSLILAVATVTSISLFTSRVQNAIYDEASQFIAADAKISGSMPIAQTWLTESQHHNLDTAQIVSFRAMAFSESQMTLTKVKAVSNRYPLKGELLIIPSKGGQSTASTHGPKSGEAWLAPRLFDALDVELGDTINIGEATFTASAAIAREPDSGQSVFGVAPRIMIHIDDVERTQAIQLGSRASYTLLIAGESENLKTYKTWIDDKLAEHFRWRDARSGNRGVGNAIDNAERFLFLTACLSVILSGVAIALSANRYAKRQQKKVALLKTLGAKPNLIVSLYSLQLLAMGLFTAGVGLLIGWLLHWGIIYSLGNLIPEDLAAASASAYFSGALTAVVALLVFAVPPILALRNIMPSSIFRNIHQQTSPSKRNVGLGAIAMILLMFFYTHDAQLTLYVSLGVAISVVCVGFVSSGLIVLTTQLSKVLPYSWRIGLASLKRHQGFNTLQIVIFSLLFLVIFVLISARTTLISQWQKQLPDDAPNHFIFNVFPSDTPALKQFFDENNVQTQPFYPMTRGRLVSVNDVDVKTLNQVHDGQMNYKRELNLTWSNTLGEDNSLVEGQWWDSTPPDSTLKVSVEEEYAKGLGMTLGDQLQFSIAGQQVEAEISSFRSVKWDSMNPNFFVIFNQDVLSASGANWITSFYLTPDKKILLNDLIRKFPTVSLVEIDQTIEQIRDITSKVSLAIEFILFLVLCSGLLVLITSIQATLDIRKKQSAIFRALGANKKLIRLSLLIEFFVMGFLAGLLATLGTEVCLYLLQTRVFQLDYAITPSLWALGPLLSAALIMAIGWQSTKSVVRTSPLEALKNT